ncbi:MAG: DNA phosphorothioation system sulfurtransferase DndC, partial [Cetobacterium sp.]
LPVSAHLIRPYTNDSFWVTLIGKGYPAPNQKFRWCTDRLKIKPANTFIKDKIDVHGEVITVLGVRSSESISRAQVIEKHRIDGKDLKKHTTLANAFVFTPIEEFTTDDIWKYLFEKNPNVWNEDNEFLMSLYRDSQDGECPLIIDKEAPSCGNSRFGCWSCTVVNEDKSLTGFLNTAQKNKDITTIKQLKPLIDFRNWLKENRNNENFRETKRQNGSLYRVDTKAGTKVGLGAYNFEARKLILEKLLIVQKESGLKLITVEELKDVQIEWNNRLGDLNNSVNQIYKNIYGENIFEMKQARLIQNDDLDLLQSLCEAEDINPEVIKRLLKIEQKYYGYIHKQNLYSEIDKILSEEWIHEDKIKDIKFGENDDNK